MVLASVRDVILNASAAAAGNGGNVICGRMRIRAFYGDILARGGNSSGNGGFRRSVQQGMPDYNGSSGYTALQSRRGRRAVA